MFNFWDKTLQPYAQLQHTSCWPLRSRCLQPLHHPQPLGVSGSPSQASSGGHRRSPRCPSARSVWGGDTLGYHQRICSWLWIKNTITSVLSYHETCIYYTWCCVSCSNSPGVADWLLEEEEFAELEPRDFRGAEAATAANKYQTIKQQLQIWNNDWSSEMTLYCTLWENCFFSYCCKTQSTGWFNVTKRETELNGLLKSWSKHQMNPRCENVSVCMFCQNNVTSLYVISTQVFKAQFLNHSWEERRVNCMPNSLKGDVS